MGTSTLTKHLMEIKEELYKNVEENLNLVVEYHWISVYYL